MSATAAAQAIIASMKQNFGAPHTMVPVDAAQLTHLNLGDYQAYRTVMEAEGFRYIADLEILEVTQAPNSVIARTMIRSLISQEGYITANYFQIRPNIGRRLRNLGKGLLNLRWLDAPANFIHGMKTRHCIDFETEFSDGRFLMTSNAESAGLLKGPPTIEKAFYPYGTPIAELYKAHESRLKTILGGDHKLQPRAVNTLAELIEMQKRQNALKVAYRAATNWVSREEIRSMSMGNADLADEVFAEVQRLLAEERRRQ